MLHVQCMYMYFSCVFRPVTISHNVNVSLWLVIGNDLGLKPSLVYFAVIIIFAISPHGIADLISQSVYILSNRV